MNTKKYICADAKLLSGYLSVTMENVPSLFRDAVANCTELDITKLRTDLRDTAQMLINLADGTHSTKAPAWGGSLPLSTNKMETQTND